MTFELFLPHRLDGLRILRQKGRTVYAVRVPREAVHQAEAHHPDLAGVGVYFLLRQVDGEPRPRVYVGEAENVAARLKQHDSGKEFWTHAVAVLDKDDFHKGQAKYLEVKAEAAARKAGRYRVENASAPAKAHLPEAQRAAAEEAFATLSVLLDLLGAPVFTAYTPASAPLPAPDAPPRPAGALPGIVAEPPAQASMPTSGLPALPVTVRCTRRGADARGLFDGKTLTVLKGSGLAEGVTASGAAKGIGRSRAGLKKHGRLAEEGGRLVFAEDYAFKTPSAAADVVMGTSAKGWHEWLLDDGQSLKRYQ